MGTSYYMYAEVRIGNKWYNINPLMRKKDGDIWVCPIFYGRSRVREAYEKLEENRYMHGRPADLSDELRQKVFYHEDDEIADHFLRDMTYKEYYGQTLFVVNYGKAVKGCLNPKKPYRYQGYAHKTCVNAFEVGEVEYISNWMYPDAYEKLSDKAKRNYTYYEWNELDDWYSVYTEIVEKVDVLLYFFTEWGCYDTEGITGDDRYPTADYVRLIIERN